MRTATILLAALFTGCAPMTVDLADGAVTPDAQLQDDAAPTNTADAQATPTDAATVDPTAPTYSNVRRIVATNCTGYCHLGSNERNAVNFADGDWSMNNVLVASTQVPRLRVVEPGDPDRSYILYKIDGAMTSLDECRADPTRCGVPMPYDTEHRVRLPENERALVRAWIAAGAPVD